MSVGTVGAMAHSPAAAQTPGASPACIAILLPEVEGVEGSATDVATGLQQLFVSYLSGPSIKVLTLDARLRTQAAEEARQKHCERILSVKLNRKRGGGKFGKVFGDAASTAAWYMPGGSTVGSAAVRGAAIAAAQAASSLAATTKAKDEMLLEYQLAGPDGKALFGPKSDKAKAHVDGEDLLTPLVRRASEAMAVDIGKK
jgi:hypothetical protein